MYKIASLARFATSVPSREAGDLWAGRHAALMRQVSPLAGYVQSQVAGPLPLSAGVSDEATFFDGYACAWWESLSDHRRATTTSAWRDVVDDGAEIFDMDWLWNMSAHLEEDVVVDGPRASYKVVWVVRFGQGLSRSEGRERWTGTHGRVAEELGVPRYVHNHVVGPIGADGETGAEIGFDGLTECWFADEQQFRDAVASPAWAAAFEEARAALDTRRLWGAALDERVVVEPPGPAPTRRSDSATSRARRRRPAA
jgi:hypothetical protein